MEGPVGGEKSDLHGAKIPDGERHPDLPINRCPFAGWRRNEGLGRSTRTRGVSSPSDDGSTTKSKGCSSSSMRRGTFTRVVLRQQTASGRSFAPGCSARAVQRFHPTFIAASGDRVGASPASDVVIGWEFLRSFAYGVLAAPERGFKRAVAARGLRDPSSRGEGYRSSKRTSVKTKASLGATAVKRGASERRENRVLEGVSRFGSCCRSR